MIETLDGLQAILYLQKPVALEHYLGFQNPVIRVVSTHWNSIMPSTSPSPRFYDAYSPMKRKPMISCMP